MVDLIVYAIPAFVVLLALELLAFRYSRGDHDDLVGYEARDTRTSLSMGGGNVVINAVWKLVVLVVYAGLYELTPLRMPADRVVDLRRCSSSPTTSPTTGSTASITRCGSSGRATSSTTPPSTTTSRPRCARPGRR